MTIWLEHGDMREVLKQLIADKTQVDSIVTDPPYHLTAGKKGGTGIASLNLNSPAGRSRISTGFMGKVWDGGDIAFQPETWRLCYDLLPPGGHLLAFGGTRTYHRMACAIEDAGFELRDLIAWVYGSGFPKSKNIGDGRGTSLKPAFEPICLARKPLEGTVAANVLAHGTGAINIDRCRVAAAGKDDYGRSAANAKGTINAHDGFEGKSFAIAERDGEYASTLGRWPANLIHDGSDEVLQCFPSSKDGVAVQRNRDGEVHNEIYGAYRKPAVDDQGYGGEGSNARFFYAAKASKADRAGSKHPTVKPISLLRYLVRLITPPNGVVLDPFAGSGTTGAACDLEGFDCIMVEREAEYAADIRRRLTVLSEYA